MGGGWAVKDAKVGMMMRHPQLGCSLSDHFSVEATLVFHPLKEAQQQQLLVPTTTSSKEKSTIPSPLPTTESVATTTAISSTGGTATANNNNNDPVTPTAAAFRNGTFLQPPSNSSSLRQQYQQQDPITNGPLPSGPESQLRSFLDTPTSSPPFLPVPVYDEILALIHNYVRREQSQRRWRAAHFFAWLAVALGSLVAVWFVPESYAAFVLMLASTLGLAAGTVDGLMSLLFFKGELRTLREFEWEIRNAREQAAAAIVSGGGGVKGGE